MQNFDYMTPTRLVFGKGVVEKLPAALAPIGKKVLLTYGGGSIKRIGLYDKVLELLKGFEIVELPGIQPNPRYDPSVLDGVRLCKEHGIEVILSVGGGSVLDCSKAIAAGACYDGDPWDLITYKVKAKAALPIVDIITLAATGSEYDSGGVISRTETNDKIAYIDEHLYPVVSFLDPTYTFSVSRKQTAAGIADAMNHTIEQYFAEDTTLLNDGFCESMLRSLMVNGRKCLENPGDYTARAEMMLCCTYGCNDILSLGNCNGQIARVVLNGHDVGTAWCEPYEVFLPPGVVKEGTNALEIEFTNVWANRLIGDEQEPPDCAFAQAPYPGGDYLTRFPDWFKEGMETRPSKGRVCFTDWNYFKKDAKLVPSGLLGPVVLH